MQKFYADMQQMLVDEYETERKRRTQLMVEMDRLEKIIAETTVSIHNLDVEVRSMLKMKAHDVLYAHGFQDISDGLELEDDIAWERNMVAALADEVDEE